MPWEPRGSGVQGVNDWKDTIKEVSLQPGGAKKKPSKRAEGVTGKS